MKKALLCLMALLILSVSAHAVANTEAGVLTGKYTTGGCAELTWTYTETTESSWDFNAFNLTTVSNVGQFNGIDENFTTITDNTIKLCTIADGDYVTFTLQPIDSNITDSNFTFIYGTAKVLRVEANSALSGGQFLVYSIFAAFASVVVLIIMVTVAIMIMSRMKIKMPGLKG